MVNEEASPSALTEEIKAKIVMHVQHVRNGVVIDEFDVDMNSIEEQSNGDH